MNLRTERVVLFCGLITAGFFPSFSQVDMDDGDKWTLTQISNNGSSWDDTSQITIYTRDNSEKLVSITNYKKDPNSSPVVWKTSDNTNFTYDNSDPLHVSAVKLQNTWSTGTTDTVGKIQYTLNANNTLASMEYKMQMKASPTVSMKITMSLFQWYNGTEIAGDSSLSCQLMYMAGTLYPPTADTTPKRSAKSTYSWTDGTVEKTGYTWDTLTQSWVAASKQTITLNGAKKPLLKVLTVKKNDTWVNSQKDSIIYTADGKIAEEVTLDWKNDAWQLSSRTVHFVSDYPAFITVHTVKKSPAVSLKANWLRSNDVRTYAINGRQIVMTRGSANSCRISKSSEYNAIKNTLLRE